MSIKWCSRELIRSPYYYGVCLDEVSFEETCKELEIPKSKIPPFVSDGSPATVNFLINANLNKRVAIVCLKLPENISPTQTIGLLVHEAVHIFQQIKAYIGEGSPSPEFEAYSIQTITEELIYAYDDIINSKNVNKPKKSPQKRS